MTTGYTTGNPATDDAISTLVEKVVIATAIAVVTLIALPLVIPTLARKVAGEQIATRARFWMTARSQNVAAIIGAVLVLALVATELLLLVRAIRHGQLQLQPGLVGTLLPWLVGNLCSGVLLLPAAWVLHRRRIAELVRSRRISDVLRQTRIEQARKRAADATAAARIGVHVHPATGKITGVRRGVITAPHTTPVGEAFAFVTRSTVITFAERFHERRQVRDWLTPNGDLLVLPRTSSAVRALLVAESGSGKTVLLDSLMLCALEYGWPVFFLDAKGDPADATHLAALATGRGKTAQVAGPWNLFAGTADQVTAKLMRLMPSPDGANQHYLDEIRGVLQAVQDHTPIRSVEDLRERLTRPAPWVRDQFDLQMVNNPVEKASVTAGTRALQALLVALRPLEKYLSPDGWSYSHPTANVTVVPLSPVDDAQARLGDLLLLDLRNFLATRLAARDKSPVLVVVDEFPQLVTDTSDPGDTAGSLFETARSAGVGLILATQSPAGLSNDETRRRRALTSGAALIVGRSKDPEDVVKYAGTVMRMESSGTASGDELRSARAQDTFVIPPQDVREAADGAFWLVQGGAIAPFRALPQASPTLPAPDPLPVPASDDTDKEIVTVIEAIGEEHIA